MSVKRRWSTLWTPLAAAALLALAAGGTAQAEDTTSCPDVPEQQELPEPPRLFAVDGVLKTRLDVQSRTICVPVSKNPAQPGQVATWKASPMKLRTYVYTDQKTGKEHWGFPGPTLQISKAVDPKDPRCKEGYKDPRCKGDSLAIKLVNSLDPAPAEACESACPAGTACPTDPAKLPDPAQCGTTKDPLCCCWVNRNQSFPNCFHGSNSTNLHFHGSHVSPQPPQDYVLLDLRPKGATATGHEVHAHGRGEVRYGEYDYVAGPFTWTQAEGTHWYHPHKHGAVGLQVANGMPGALIVLGEFDLWLRDYYGGNLPEKLLVLQMVEQDTNLYDPNAAAPKVLVNGLPNPKVSMQPGEVQRWRFVNATIKGGAQLQVMFPAGTTVVQIAMDGVRFAPENYRCQPLYNPSSAPECGLTPVATPAVTIFPGNRADFLVQAPAAKGKLEVEHRIVGNLAQQRLEKVRALEAELAPDDSEPPLVTIEVAGERPVFKGLAATPKDNDSLPDPDQWPPMPEYLWDVTDEQVGGRTRAMTFNMDGPQGNPATKFFIDGQQFRDDCIQVTTKLDLAEEWTVSNDSPLQHPFHIHTNPFQVVRNDTTTFKKPWIWQDTIGLPKGTVPAPKSVVLRQRYEEFTGEYVLHCHFLGHEDRGMMFSVQTVCKDHPGSYGKARQDGKPECVPDNLVEAPLPCKPKPADGTPAGR